ncbi:hypothetical protein RYH80_18110 [Halobaculum sp. MBLA0147]|uniref:hypothetical protein n=1 Tax=Halobaculum sp. MBLA0147 TaxID=3079934 RepID=UPI0035238A97
MAESEPSDPLETHREAVLEAVADQADPLATALATVHSGKYFTRTVQTPTGKYTIKAESGDPQWLRFEPGDEDDIYLISSRDGPEEDPRKVARAVDDWEEFLTAVEDLLTAKAETAETARETLAEIDTTSLEEASERALAARDDYVDTLESALTPIAEAWQQISDDRYPSLKLKIGDDETLWELSIENGAPSYLRYGGRGGTYLYGDHDPGLDTVVANQKDIAAFIQKAVRVIKNREETASDLDLLDQITEIAGEDDD